MTVTPEPAGTGRPHEAAAGPAGESDPSASTAEQRRSEMLEQLIEMRRDEAAAEDAEDFGWAEELRAHPFRHPAQAQHETPEASTPA